MLGVVGAEALAGEVVAHGEPRAVVVLILLVLGAVAGRAEVGVGPAARVEAVGAAHQQVAGVGLRQHADVVLALVLKWK